MHDIRNQKAPSTLQNLFIDNNRIQSYNTQSSIYIWKFLYKEFETRNWEKIVFQSTGKSMESDTTAIKRATKETI